MTPEGFNALFDTFHSSAFRLETLQAYALSAEDASLRAFREGSPRPERSVRTSPWLRRLALTTAAGKSWSRVHLIRRPLSEYLRYEIVGYVESQSAGEVICLADLDLHPELAPLRADFLALRRRAGLGPGGLHALRRQRGDPPLRARH